MLCPFHHRHLITLDIVIFQDCGNVQSDYVVACESIRVACSKDPCNASLWNVFGHITSCTGGLNRHHKFILRMKAIQPESIPLAMLLGHYHAMNGNWMAAVAEYRHVFRDDLKDPLVSLCIGLAFLHHAMTRKVLKLCNMPIHAMW